ncbi:MAG: L-serine ammonia-lyase, iron-sulfur-dependent, subunit alpha [Clostridia bacterium]
MSFDFFSGEALLSLCKQHDMTISQVMIQRELQIGNLSVCALREEMAQNLAVMRASIEKGLAQDQCSVTGLTGGDAEKLNDYAAKAHMGSRMARVVAASMAVVEVNAGMGRIVAAPTAGASGILPGALIVCGEECGWSDDQLIDGLFTAAAVGALIARNATISGAEGGCQAETGTAAAMAAAAIVELSGGKPPIALHAAAITLKNVMGLVCDPVAGLVECPCIKRNALGAVNAVLCADMALAGISSMIPFDEVVMAMKSVGRLMSPDLRETAKGGLASTPTGKAMARRLGLGLYAKED